MKKIVSFHLVMFFVALMPVLNTQAAVTNDSPAGPSLEQVTTISFVSDEARTCHPEASKPTSEPTLRGDALYAILLAAQETGIEVTAIESDSCAQDFSAR